MNLRVKASAYAPIGRPAALAGFDRQGLAELICDLKDQAATAAVVVRVLEGVQPSTIAPYQSGRRRNSLALGLLVGMTAVLAVQRSQTEAPPPRLSGASSSAMVFEAARALAPALEPAQRAKPFAEPSSAESVALSPRPLRPLVSLGVELAALPPPPPMAMAEPLQARPAPIEHSAVEAPIVRSQGQPDLLGGGFNQDRLVETSQGSALGGDTAQRMASAIGGF